MNSFQEAMKIGKSIKSTRTSATSDALHARFVGIEKIDDRDYATIQVPLKTAEELQAQVQEIKNCKDPEERKKLISSLYAKSGNMRLYASHQPAIVEHEVYGKIKAQATLIAVVS